MTENGQHLQPQGVIPKRPHRCTPRKNELPKFLLPQVFFSPPFFWPCPDAASWCRRRLDVQLSAPTQTPASHPPPDPCSGTAHSCCPDSREKPNSPRCWAVAVRILPSPPHGRGDAPHVHKGTNPTVVAMVFCLPMSTGPCLKDALLQARPCLRGGEGVGEKVRMVSFRKGGAEERTSGKASHWRPSRGAGLASGRWYEQKQPLQLPVFQLFLFKLPCLRLWMNKARMDGALSYLIWVKMCLLRAGVGLDEIWGSPPAQNILLFYALWALALAVTRGKFVGSGRNHRKSHNCKDYFWWKWWKYFLFAAEAVGQTFSSPLRWEPDGTSYWMLMKYFPL